MWRRRLTFAGVMFLAAGGTAQAGSLAEVSHGLHVAAGDSGSKRPGSGGGDESHQDDESSSSTPSESSCCNIKTDGTLGYAYSYGPAAAPGQDAQAEIYLGAQSVSNSDGSMTIEAR